MSAIFAAASTAWADMKAEYDAALAAAHALAETETNGNLVNRKGKAKGLTGWDMFTGPEIRARNYASEELLDHWNKHPRPNLNRFEAQWTEGRLSWN